MNRNRLLYISLGAAFVAALVTMVLKLLPGASASLLSFPLAQIAEGLGALSGLGVIGNGAAVALWLGISLIPICAAVLSKKAGRAERITLVGLSVAIAVAIYGAVNPAIFAPVMVGGRTVPSESVVYALNTTVLSLLILYAVLVLVRLFRSDSRSDLLRHLMALAKIGLVVASVVAAILIVSGMMDFFAPGDALPDRAMGALRTLANVTGCVMELFVLWHLLIMLDSAVSETQEGLPEAAAKLQRVCRIFLAVSAALAFGVNLLNVLMMRWLQNSSTNLNISLSAILFFAVILLVCGLLVDNKELREDNELFV